MEFYSLSEFSAQSNSPFFALRFLRGSLTLWPPCHIQVDVLGTQSLSICSLRGSHQTKQLVKAASAHTRIVRNLKLKIFTFESLKHHSRKSTEARVCEHVNIFWRFFRRTTTNTGFRIRHTQSHDANKSSTTSERVKKLENRRYKKTYQFVKILCELA